MSTSSQGGGPFTIRRAIRGDADRIAQLSMQLAYPSSREEVERRLSLIEQDGNHAVYVAAGPDGQIRGWLHVNLSYLVESDPEAEIGGLVVDESYRRAGVGRLLMQQAEQWARAKGLKSVYLRSNIIRQSAHTFYKKLGFNIVKTQHAFRKYL